MIRAVLVATTLWLYFHLAAADWPQWRGPNRDAISPDQGLLQEWPQGGPPLLWKTTGLGGGFSAPSVAGGKVFGMSHLEGELVVWALSESDGRKLWMTRLGPAPSQSWPQGREGPGCTPTVDGDRVYVLGMGGTLACLRVTDGTVLWKKNLIEDFGGLRPTWSYRESPLIDGEKLICTPGGDDALMVALDKMSGKPIWKLPNPDRAESSRSGPARQGNQERRPSRRRGFGMFSPSGASYASAIVIEAAGVRQYVQFAARAVIGVRAEDGKLLWRYDRPANRVAINCSTPIYHDGMVFASSAYGAGAGVVRLVRLDDGSIRAEEVWFTREMQNHHGGVVLISGYLYGASGGNEGGALICQDWKTGKVMWDLRRSPERPAAKGSIAYADGRIYYRTEDGTVLLIEPSPERYIERGRFMQPERSEQNAWTHPVIANGRLYLRDQDLLLVYDIKKK